MTFMWVLLQCMVILAVHGTETTPISIFGDKSLFTPNQVIVQDKFADLIPLDYNIHEPPPLIHGEPVPVTFSVSIKNIPEINEINQMISIEMNLRISWQDTRLINTTNILFTRNGAKRSYITLNPVALSHIWSPDIFTDYIKSVTHQQILSPPIALRIYPNATIKYSARKMIEMGCPMEFSMYPADSQRCFLRIQSYGFTREELSFSWVSDGMPMNIDHRLAHFDHMIQLINDKEEIIFNSENHPGIAICLRFQRRMNYHILQTYIPSSLFVVVSWLSFAVPRDCASGRLAISMTTLLTLTAMFAAVRQNTPAVSYIKALDIWMFGCIVCVFFSLAQFVAVLRVEKLAKVRERKIKNVPLFLPRATVEGKIKSVSQKLESGQSNFDEASSPIESGGDIKLQQWSHNPKEKLNSMEEGNTVTDGNHKSGGRNKMSINPFKRMVRIIEVFFPFIAIGTFVLFNICYWPWILKAPSFGRQCD